MIVGFTGIRQGMSESQRDQLSLMLMALKGRVNVFHHGGAVGADQQALDLALQVGYEANIHLSAMPKLAKQLLARNRQIVEMCAVLIAGPASDKEELRSGTWATIRYARRAGKPVVMLSRGKE